MSHFCRFFAICLALYPWLILAETSQDSMQSANAFFHYLAQFNRYSPMEAAGAHGSFGAKLGIGLVNSSWTETNQYHRELLEANFDDQSSVNTTKFYAVKGTPWPIDFGMTLANLPQTTVSLAGAHINWAVLEGLGIPSIAARATYSRIIGMKDTSFQSTGLDAVMSYGVLRYFTAYAGLGGQLNKGQIDLATNTELSVVQRGEEMPAAEAKFYSMSQFLGLQITVVPALFSATAEFTRNSKGFESVAGKLNVEI
jgi:hypothetical protein